MEKNGSPRIESNASDNKASRWIGLIFIILFMLFLLFITVFALLMPNVVGQTLVNTVPIWWIAVIYVILSSASAPSSLIIDNMGLHIRILWWQDFLSWQNIDRVVEYKYHTFVYSKNLPLISLLQGILLFRFSRLFTINWRRQNYALVVDMMRKNLGAKFENN
ncbi:MAG: hypothetical protein K8L97_14385 [Anaerolineae bacterium]|nr:hypothetical protein [Anaerolineae bacterium]